MEISAWFRAYLKEYTPYKTDWNYEDGCILKACIDLFRATGEETYRQFVLTYLERFVGADGSIPSFDTQEYNTASINSGKALFFALEQTGEEKWRKAIEFHMQRLREHPRCDCGSFWHKENYPGQVFLDGLYKALPFYMAYEMQFGGMEKVADVVLQFRNVRRFMWDAQTGLNRHGWDEKRQQRWAEPETGLSAGAYLRAEGWYLMALVDTIEICSNQLYEHWRALVDLFRESLAGMLRYETAEHLFLQSPDHPEAEGNYAETSGSAMIAYAVLKGVRLGLLDPEKYGPIGRRIFEAVRDHKLVREEDGVVRLTDICWSVGLGPAKNPHRDGSVAYYIGEKRRANDVKGVAPFMMAYSEYIR